MALTPYQSAAQLVSLQYSDFKGKCSSNLIGTHEFFLISSELLCPGLETISRRIPYWG